MARTLTAEPVTAVVTHHGEGPVWDAAHGVLRCVDLLAGALVTYDPASGGVRRRTVGTVAAMLRPRASGGFVVARERDVVLLADPDDPDGAVAVLAALPAPDGVRCNDGGCTPDGDLLVGTMAYAETPGAGALYRVTPSGAVTTVVPDASIANGLCFDPTGTFAYWADTPTGRVDRLTFAADGALAGRGPFVAVDPADGYPDGLTVDAEGGVWVALWGGSGVRRYAPDGTLDVAVRVGARQVSCPAFGGPDLADLYVTTSRQGLDDGDDPLAGSLFRVTPGVRGLPVLPFAG